MVRRLAQLTIRALCTGTLQVPGDALAPGTTLPRGEHLYDVVGPGGVKGDAFVDDHDVTRMATGDSRADRGRATGSRLLKPGVRQGSASPPGPF